MKTTSCILLVVIFVAVTESTGFMDYIRRFSNRKMGAGVSKPIKTNKPAECRKLYQDCPIGYDCCRGLKCHADQTCWKDLSEALKQQKQQEKITEEKIKMLGRKNEEKRKQQGWKPISRSKSRHLKKVLSN